MRAWRDATREESGLRLAVIGKPVAQSLSPKMQSAALRELGVAGSYEAFEVEPEELRDCLSHLADCGFRGVNVTIPYKSPVAALCELEGSEAIETGCVNTVQFGEKWVGRNTDVAGFLHPIRTWPPGEALLIGAGGAAEAAAYALLTSGWSVSLWNRTAERAEELARRFSRFGSIQALVTPEEASADLVVSAIPAPGEENLFPVRFETLSRSAAIYDLAYAEGGTRLTRWAIEAGRRVVDGREMLVEQGALALEWWTGLTAPRPVMRAAIGLPPQEI